MKKLLLIISLIAMAAMSASAETYLDGFVQGLYGARLDENNPTATEHTASETRLQMRLQHFGDNAEFFSRTDFWYDAADSSEYDFELREAFLKFRLGSNFDFKIGRQILTWGTGDLIFINDVFAKDYRSFFVGRDDQYLKAPQTALRIEYYNSVGAFSVIWTPRFEANRIPTGRKLSYFSPMAGDIVGDGYYFMAREPEAKIENGELATRFSRRIGNFNAAGYFYHGFYKNPVGFDPDAGVFGMPIYPKLNIYGASVRGSIAGGILWLEGGYFDSRDDRDNNNDNIPNSSISTLVGFERQIANNLTANIQYQFEQSEKDDGVEYTDDMNDARTRHLLTSRVTKLLYNELVTLSGFVFYSPDDEDAYIRLSVAYKYTDELNMAIGGNIFTGTDEYTQFGSYQRNDNIYLKFTYGFSN